MFKINQKDQPSIKVFEGVTRRTLACGKDVLMARFEYEKDARVPPHKHAYEQITTVLEGKQRIVIRNGNQEEKILVAEGDSYIVPVGYEHEQKSLTKSVTIDSWSVAP